MKQKVSLFAPLTLGKGVAKGFKAREGGAQREKRKRSLRPGSGRGGVEPIAGGGRV